jgi:hypothetical protein
MFSTSFTLAFLAFAVVVWMWYSGMFRRFVPNAEKAIPLMTLVSIKPEPRSPGEARSELLIVGHYAPGGNLVLYKTLVKYRIYDDAWLEDKTDKVVDMEITHWIKASEQGKLS